MNINFQGRAMADDVSRLLFTEKARFRYYASLLEVCGGQSDADTGFSPKFLLSSIIIISPMCYTLLQLMLLLPEGPMFKPWEPSENNTFSKIGEHCIEKFFQFFSLQRVPLLPVVPDFQ
jgi:hypothetical protein